MGGHVDRKCRCLRSGITFTAKKKMQADGEQQRSPSKEGKKKAYYDRIIFIVDPFKAQKEEDDFKDSIAYYYPSSELEDDSKIFLCGQISGTYKILLNFPGSPPEFIQNQQKGFAVKTLGRRFILSMLSRSLETPAYTLRLLKEIHGIFVFYHHSPENILRSCQESWDALCLHLKSVMPFYMRFILLMNQSHMSSAFQHIPYFISNGGKVESSVFLKSSQLLQWCKRSLSVFGGCVLYQKKIICSHLPQSLCQRVLILAENEELQSYLQSALKDDHQLPVGHMYYVYLTEEELSSVSTTHRSVVPQVYRNLALSLGFRTPGRARRTSRRHRSGSVQKDTPNIPQYTVIHATPNSSIMPPKRDLESQTIKVSGMKAQTIDKSSPRGKKTSKMTQSLGSPPHPTSSPVDIAGLTPLSHHQGRTFLRSVGQTEVSPNLYTTPTPSLGEGLDSALVTPVDSDAAKETRELGRKGTSGEDYTSGEDPPFRTPSSSLVGKIRNVVITNTELFGEEGSSKLENAMTQVKPVEGVPKVDPTEGVSGVDPTEGVSGTDPTDGVSVVNPTEGVSGTDPTEGVLTVDPTEGVSEVNSTEGVSGMEPTVGVSGVEPTEGVSGVEPTEDVSGVGPTEGMSGVKPTEGMSGVGPTEGVSGVEPTEHVSGTDPTEGVSGVDHKGGISGVESKKAVSVEESEPVEQENKTVDSEKYLSSTNLSAAEQSPLQIPNDGGPQLEQCCMVVMRCLQTSIVLIGSTQLSENIEDFRKMWKETFQCLNDINATVKLNRLGEEPASSKPSNGITVSFSGIQGHVEKCPEETTYFQRQCIKLMHTEFSCDSNLLQCTLTKPHCRMFGQRLGQHEAYLQPERKLAQKYVSGTKVESALLFHSLPEECAHLLHKQDKKRDFPFL